MLHKRFRKQLPLLVYGDLLSREETKIKRHLTSCEACRIELKELQGLRTIAAGVKGVTVDSTLLSEARSQLSMSLNDLYARTRPTRGEGFLETILPLRPGLFLGGATAIVLAALLVGRYIVPATDAKQHLSDPFADVQGLTLSHVHIVGYRRHGTTGQEIELAFDATRSMRMRGLSDDPTIQRVIAYAILNGDNPGVRMRAVSSIDPRAGGMFDREIKAALLLALNTDPNDGVRKAALEALLRYPGDREIRDGLLEMLLADENPGLRVAAVKGLDTLVARGFEPDAGMRNSLKEHMHKEDNLFVRAKAESILKGKIQ